MIWKCRNPRTQTNPLHQEKETQGQIQVLIVQIEMIQGQLRHTLHSKNKDKTRRSLTQLEQHITSLLCHL